MTDFRELPFPDCINYDNKYYSIPQETQSYITVAVPSNGSTFTSGQQIIVDIQSPDFIEPSSIWFRYKDTTTAAVGAQRLGTPAYTPFQRLDTLVNGGSKVIESIGQYNQVANMIVNCAFDTAQRAGMQSLFGYVDAGTTAPSFANMDGRLLALNETASYGGLLLGSCLTSTDQLLPPRMGGMRLIFTIDTIANMYSTAVVPTAYSIFNFEVVYTCVKFPREYVENIFKHDKIYLKTMSFANTAQTVPTGTTGTVSLVYNQRFNSLKSAFIHASGTAATSIHKNFDSLDITTNNGNYQLLIGGYPFPNLPLSTTNNKNGILMSTRQAVGSLYNPTNSLSIPSVNWNYTSASTTTSTSAAKFYVGIMLEKLTNSQNLISGVSTMNQPITLTMNINTATSQAHNVNLILLFDMIMEIDTATQQINIIQ